MLPLIVAVLAAGCGRGDASAVAHVVRDSAGVRIVESSAAGWADERAWRIAAEPHLRIGADPLDPDQQLHEVAGATRLSDGSVVVANAGTQELRFYAADGQLLATGGRNGEGPGEFRSLGFLRRWTGDTVVVHDSRLQRISIFGPGGEFVRSARLDPADGSPSVSPIALLDDGTLVARPNFVFGDGTRSGLHRDSITLLGYDLAGAFRGSLGRTIDRERFVYAEGTNQLAGFHPFGRTTSVAASGEGYVVGTADRHEITVHAPSGALVAVIRRLTQPVPLTDADVARYRREALAEQEKENVDESFRALWARVLNTIPFPDVRPAYGRILGDTDGNLWVKRWAWPGEETQEWEVFDPEGRWLGVVAMPAGLDPLEIGSDYVLGRWRDELEVEHVVMYGIQKP